MKRKNGVSEFFGKLLSYKTGGSAHSTQHCKINHKSENTITRPYMAESCGGCDEHDSEIIAFPAHGFVGGLN